LVEEGSILLELEQGRCPQGEECKATHA
jgi:hypothetical protein